MVSFGYFHSPIRTTREGEEILTHRSRSLVEDSRFECYEWQAVAVARRLAGRGRPLPLPDEREPGSANV